MVQDRHDPLLPPEADEIVQEAGNPTHGHRSRRQAPFHPHGRYAGTTVKS